MLLSDGTSGIRRRGGEAIIEQRSFSDARQNHGIAEVEF